MATTISLVSAHHNRFDSAPTAVDGDSTGPGWCCYFEDEDGDGFCDHWENGHGFRWFAQNLTPGEWAVYKSRENGCDNNTRDEGEDGKMLMVSNSTF